MREIPPLPPNPAAACDPDWLAAFRVALERADLAAATVQAYLKDVRLFLRWLDADPAAGFPRMSELDLIAWRQHLIAERGLRPATVNRRLEALRRLGRWAAEAGRLPGNLANGVRPLRQARDRQPVGLTIAEVHALLRAAGASGHGHARRDYALVQLLVQTGLRVGEAAALRRADVEVRERSGLVRVRDGKGGKAREVPLNAMARRALRLYLEQRPDDVADALFLSGRHAPLPVRSIQAIVGRLARRARLDRLPVSAHTLRHTFALNFLRANPGQLVELASLLGHESLDTTALYTRPSRDDLAAGLERSPLNDDR
ncbi:MAG: tyrosine-type recombinase/integrase [Alphaproteobacteria bacterium]|nr:tyrosine-type recombinase/integrase [Alphaproteobacteria bacterium]